MPRSGLSSPGRGPRLRSDGSAVHARQGGIALADPVPPDFVEKRRVLYGRGQEKRIAAAARALVASGRLSEALEFLERTRDRDAIEEVRRRAVASGDSFALQRAGQLLGVDPDPSEWRDLAARAGAEERWYDAVRALEKAGDAEGAEQLRLEHHPDYKPFKPAGK